MTTCSVGLNDEQYIPRSTPKKASSFETQTFVQRSTRQWLMKNETYFFRLTSFPLVCDPKNTWEEHWIVLSFPFPVHFNAVHAFMKPRQQTFLLRVKRTHTHIEHKAHQCSSAEYFIFYLWFQHKSKSKSNKPFELLISGRIWVKIWAVRWRQERMFERNLCLSVWLFGSLCVGMSCKKYKPSYTIILLCEFYDTNNKGFFSSSCSSRSTHKFFDTSKRHEKQIKLIAHKMSLIWFASRIAFSYPTKPTWRTKESKSKRSVSSLPADSKLQASQQRTWENK